jgi:hypothetical protein
MASITGRGARSLRKTSQWGKGEVLCGVGRVQEDTTVRILPELSGRLQGQAFYSYKGSVLSLYFFDWR